MSVTALEALRSHKRVTSDAIKALEDFEYSRQALRALTLPGEVAKVLDFPAPPPAPAA